MEEVVCVPTLTLLRIAFSVILCPSVALVVFVWPGEGETVPSKTIP